jgi:hypothetical protein
MPAPQTQTPQPSTDGREQPWKAVVPSQSATENAGKEPVKARVIGNEANSQTLAA